MQFIDKVNLKLKAGNGGNGGLGGNYAIDDEDICSCDGGDGGNGGDALAVKTLTVNAGSLKAIGGNGGNGGSGQNVRYGGSAGNGGWGVNIKDGGAFNINVADDYKGIIYLASGKGGAGGEMMDRPNGESPAAVNILFNASTFLIVSSSKCPKLLIEYILLLKYISLLDPSNTGRNGISSFLILLFEGILYIESFIMVSIIAVSTLTPVICCSLLLMLCATVCDSVK